MNWFKNLFKKKAQDNLTPEEVNRKILLRLNEMNGDILCIMDKQIQMYGMQVEKFSGVVFTKNFAVMNVGEHEWVCKACGLPVQECKEADKRSLN